MCLLLYIKEHFHNNTKNKNVIKVKIHIFEYTQIQNIFMTKEGLSKLKN